MGDTEMVRLRTPRPAATFGAGMILSGALLSRHETVAPTVGVIHTLRLRLDLLTLAAGTTSSVEIEVKALSRDLHTLIVQELRRRAAAG